MLGHLALGGSYFEPKDIPMWPTEVHHSNSATTTNSPEYPALLSCRQQCHTHPEWNTAQSRNAHHRATPTRKKMRNWYSHRHCTKTSLRIFLFVSVEDNIRVSIIEFTVVILGPGLDLLKQVASKIAPNHEIWTCLEFHNPPYLDAYLLPSILPSRLSFSWCFLNL